MCVLQNGFVMMFLCSRCFFAFSTRGRILSDYMSRMISETVEALVCLRDLCSPCY
jgi:hypothetical protein